MWSVVVRNICFWPVWQEAAGDDVTRIWEAKYTNSNVKRMIKEWRINPPDLTWSKNRDLVTAISPLLSPQKALNTQLCQSEMVSGCVGQLPDENVQFSPTFLQKWAMDILSLCLFIYPPNITKSHINTHKYIDKMYILCIISLFCSI